MKRVDDSRGCCRCDAPGPNWKCALCGEVCCLGEFRTFDGLEPSLPFCSPCITLGRNAEDVVLTDAQRMKVVEELIASGELKQ